MKPAMPVMGLIGLGAMGRNLGWRLVERGWQVTALSYDPAEPERFSRGLPWPGAGGSHKIAADIETLVRLLPQPRVILLMVTAGAAVDRVLNDLLPHLAPDDIVIDGGNSHFHDTLRRQERLGQARIGYIGAGISGGEAGARHGASIMVGADAAGYARCRPLLEDLAARIELPGREPALCVERVGPAGAGHFVKMVHNGIEYALMQIIAEIWYAMATCAGWSRDRQQAAFAHFAEGPAAGFLIDVTAAILATREADGEGYLIDHISDRVAQKGTGRWTVEAALTLGVPIPSIAAAVMERALSSTRDASTEIASAGAIPMAVELDEQAFEQALLAGSIASFAQGFALLDAASRAHDWQLDRAAIARIWQGGCIIRTRLLEDLERACRSIPAPGLLTSDARIGATLSGCLPGWRAVVTTCAATGNSAPALAASLAWHDSQNAGRLPTRLIAAQRDFFGAHGFERTDQAGIYHGPWQRDPS